MGPSIDDLVPAERAAMAPTLRIDRQGRVILTVLTDGIHRRLVLDADQVAGLVGDVVRMALVIKPSEAMGSAPRCGRR